MGGADDVVSTFDQIQDLEKQAKEAEERRKKLEQTELDAFQDM